MNLMWLGNTVTLFGRVPNGHTNVVVVVVVVVGCRDLLLSDLLFSKTFSFRHRS